MVDSADPAESAEFWSGLLERPVVDRTADAVVVALDGSANLVFVPVAEPKVVPNRLHLDLVTTSPQHRERLPARARERGAVPVDIGQGAVPWEVLADPAGNEFCVLEPRDEYLGIGPVAAVVVNAADPVALAGFWSHATGLPVTRQGPGFASLRREDGFWLEFVQVTEPKVVKNRLHLDVAPPPDGDLVLEVARLEACGAVRADVGQSVVPWVVLADPEGNEFCVLTPR